MIDHQEIQQWIEEVDVVNQLIEYVKQPSRSNLSQEVLHCAEYISNQLVELGLKVEMIETSGNPLVLASKSGAPESTSLLIYGHYDIQPEGDLDLWEIDPFEPEVRDGKLWGRGTADNKGQHYAHIKALEYFKKQFPDRFERLDIRIILDGDEERGSFSLSEVFSSHKDKLDADIMIVSDGPSLVSDRPTIVGSVRGILSFQIVIQHNPTDLHSGNFGGLARSASQDLLSLLHSMVDTDGRCKIAGFYDDVKSANPFEQELIDNLDHVFQSMQLNRGYHSAITQGQLDTKMQNQFWPTFNINGIKAGGVKTERRTIIPAEAVASIDCRLVPAMESDKIKQLIQDHIDRWAIANNCQESVRVVFEHAMETLESSLNDPQLAILEEALTAGFGVKPLLVPRLGGSLPLYLFPQYLEKKVFLIPYALPDENNHAPNENLDPQYFYNGIKATVHLLELITR